MKEINFVRFAELNKDLTSYIMELPGDVFDLNFTTTTKIYLEIDNQIINNIKILAIDFKNSTAL